MHSTDSGNQENLANRLDAYLSDLERGVTQPGCLPSETPSSGLYEIVGDLHRVSAALQAEAGSKPFIGKYRVKHFLGSGGQSKTYLAEDPDLQRMVVLKLYHQINGSSAHRTVLQEGRLLSKVNSPFVVKCFAVESLSCGGSDGDERVVHQRNDAHKKIPLLASQEDSPSHQQPYLVLEFVEGIALDVLLRLERMQTEKIRSLIAELARGLACVHAAGLIHRDIKPGNIIVGVDGQPKLVDFGLALSLEFGIQRPGSGTTAYMSPEQAQRRCELDERTDIFGLGAVMYHLLSGFPPYRATSTDALRKMAEAGKIEDVRQLNPLADKGLAKVCMRCLEIDPDTRIQSADDLLRSLEKPTRLRATSMGIGIWGAICVCALSVAYFLFSDRLPTTHSSAVDALTVKVFGGVRNEQGIYEFQADATPHLAVTLNSPGFLRVWSQEGNVDRQLFPNEVQPDRRIASGETILVPDPDQAVLKLGVSVETEFFRIVISDDPLPLLRGTTDGYFVCSDSPAERERLNASLQDPLGSPWRSAEVAVRSRTKSIRGQLIAESFIPFRVLPNTEVHPTVQAADPAYQHYVQDVDSRQFESDFFNISDSASWTARMRARAHPLLLRGEIDKAIEEMQTACSLADENGGKHSLMLTDAKFWLACVLWSAGKERVASRVFREAWQSCLLASEFSTDADLGSRALAAITWRYMGYWIATLDLQSAEDVRLAYDAIWNSRGLVDWVALQGVLKSLPTPLQSEYGNLAILKREALLRFLSEPQFAAFNARISGRELLTQAECREDSLQISQRLVNADAGYRRATQLRHASVEDLVNGLGPTTGLIEILELPAECLVPGNRRSMPARPRTYVAFIIKQGAQEPSLCCVDLGPAQELEQVVNNWLRPESTDSATTRIRKLIWERLQPELQGMTGIVIVPQGQLSALPWSALPIDDHGGCLIDALSVSYANSGQEILHLFQQPEIAGQTMLVVGGVDYGVAPEIPQPHTMNRSASLDLSRHSTHARRSRRTWTQLAASVEEVRAISNFYASENLVLLTGESATKENVITNLPAHRYVHFATHGFCEESLVNGKGVISLEGQDLAWTQLTSFGDPSGFKLDELEMTGLVFTGANFAAADADDFAATDRTDEGAASFIRIPLAATGELSLENAAWLRSPATPKATPRGILKGSEIAALHLPQTELVVLSACESARGSTDAEGVLGLHRAFHLAGARSVLASLWKVEDELARVFMTRFYENLLVRGMSNRDALRDAQLALRAGDLTEGQTQPLSAWAGWVLSGDYR